MRLETISEGKAIILSKEAHEFAMEYTVHAWRMYKHWERKIESREITILDRFLGQDTFTRTIELHPKYRPGPTEVVVLTDYLFRGATEGHYQSTLGDVIEINIEIGCANSKLSDMYIYETLIHEMTHAVDPKLNKQIEGARWQYDVNKIRAGATQDRKTEYMRYARQPVEIEAHTWQVANRFVRFFKEKGLKKAEIIDKARNFTPDIIKEVYGAHAYGWISEVYLNNKAYRRKLLNTILNIASQLIEADMSRRQFLKLGGQAAMAAAAPKQALKGLIGGGVPREILVSVQPSNAGVPGLENDIDNITTAFKAAQKLGGAVGGSNVGGEAYEFFTMADPAKLNDLMASGVLKPLRQRQFQNFNKPIGQETLEKFKKDARETVRAWVDSNKGLNVKLDVEQETQRRYEELIRQEQYARSIMYLVDEDAIFYLITTPNEATAADYQAYIPIVNHGIGDLISDWWRSEIGDLRDHDLTKPVVELIKQKRLYSDLSNPFELNHLMQAFAKFKITPPSDITQVIARLNKPRETGGPTYDEVKRGDTWESWSKRKKAEDNKTRADEKAKQKREFDEAPPSQETPDSWRTQSVEFEHKLVARLRRL